MGTGSFFFGGKPTRKLAPRAGTPHHIFFSKDRMQTTIDNNNNNNLSWAPPPASGGRGEDPGPEGVNREAVDVGRVLSRGEDLGTGPVFVGE